MSAHQQITRRTWSEKEKNILKELHKNHGERCFDLVPLYILGRSTKDAKQIWKYHHNDKFRKDPFTHEEQEKIKYLRETEKMGWIEMEKYLPGRDQIRLRNEYRKIKRHEELLQLSPKVSKNFIKEINAEPNLFNFQSSEKILDSDEISYIIFDLWEQINKRNINQEEESE
jgi:hypothetical protein